MPQGKTLRIEVLEPAKVHCSGDGWSVTQESETRDPGLGVHFVDLPTEELASGSKIVFTFFWPGAGHWEGADFTVAVE
jgi:glucoamylase